MMNPPLAGGLGHSFLYKPTGLRPNAMSNAQLDDIGVSRSQIDGVAGGRGAKRRGDTGSRRLSLSRLLRPIFPS